MWILARAKLKEGRRYYGAYPGGFPERARVLLGASLNTPVLHVCGGMARFYPYSRGFGPYDKTLDLDPETSPDFLQDARLPYPLSDRGLWRAILMDPPYSEEEAANYKVGSSKYPRPGSLLANAMVALRLGGRVGIIHYLVPKTPEGARFVAVAGVMVGQNNRLRAFTVFEKEA